LHILVATAHCICEGWTLRSKEEKYAYIEATEMYCSRLLRILWSVDATQDELVYVQVAS